MAKKDDKPKKTLGPRDATDALDKLERPEIRWKIVLQILGALAILWLLAGGAMPWIGWWGIGVAGVLTAVVLGFAIYVWRLTKKSQAMVDILKKATTKEGRAEALAQLEAGDAKDAMNALARSQLVAQEDPQEAIRILEAVDVKKAPAVAQDDLRANLGMLYLLVGRTADAREVAELVRLDRQPQPKAKAMYAAVVAEAFARTGKHGEAKKLLETYPATDPAYGEVSTLLYRAQVYTFFATKNRGLARKAMDALAEVEPNALGPFLKSKNPELVKMAKDVLTGSGLVPRQKMKLVR